MFQLAKTLTNMIIFPVSYDLKSDEWTSTFENVENLAKTFLEKLKVSS